MSRQGTTVELEEARIEHLDDLSKPLVLRLRYRLKGALHALEGHLVGRTPFALEMPLEMTTRTEIAVPDGFEVTVDVASGASAPGRQVTWSARQEKSGKVVKVSFDCRRAAGRYPAEEYQTYRETLEAARAGAEPSVAFRKVR